MKNRVLVTAIGTAASTTIIKELRKTDQYYIIGADMANKNEIATSLDVDEYYKFPPSIGEEYIPFALDFCDKHDIKYYYAIIDNEVVNLTKNKEKFKEIGTKLCLPDYEFTFLCHYKDLFYSWLKENFPNVAINGYSDLSEITQDSYPLFIKPFEGAASRGCRKIDNHNELLSILTLEELGKTVLVQDFVEGDLITVDYLRNRATGQTLQIQRREILRNSDGCGIAVEIINDEELRSICDDIMRKLDLNGVVNIEFFKTKKGFKLIEINPRHSAGTVYSCMAGGDTVLNAINIAEEKPCIIGDIEYGSHYAKRYEAYRTE